MRTVLGAIALIALGEPAFAQVLGDILPKTNTLPKSLPGEMTAANAKEDWDPLGDDPKANFEDGKTYPDEAAIRDRQANADAKMQAWERRYNRLVDQGKDMPAVQADNHMRHWQRKWEKEQ